MERYDNWLRLWLFILVMVAAAHGWPQALVNPSGTGVDVRVPVSSRDSFASNIVIPQIGAFAQRAEDCVAITGVTARVKILEQTATTALQIELRNSTASRQEAELVVPLPAGAVISGFAFAGSASEAMAQVLPLEEGRAVYERIVAQVRDPALLEFTGYNIARSSVFPIDAGGTQSVRLTYEQVLPRDGARLDYLLPRSESPMASVPWEITLLVESKDPISTVYSPTHQLVVDQRRPGQVVARIAETAQREPGPFLLSCLKERQTVTASLMAYPDPAVGGGYFLLLAGLPENLPEHDVAAIKRDVTFVLDRSGSMNGEKFEQAREAALQVFEGLNEGEFFNLLVYNDTVDRFASAPVEVTPESREKVREYLKGITSGAGTNLHDALHEALRQEPSEGALPIVLFLTDGLPTVGETSEIAIRGLAEKANPHNRRIFTFGVGADVNTPLLDALSSGTRGSAAYILPGEDVEVKVAQVFNRLNGPVLADAGLEVLDGGGRIVTHRVKEILPAKVPDLFEGDQLIVLGKYAGDEPLHFQLTGNCLGRQRTFRFDFELDKATTRNAFVPRLWASRKIAVLVDEVRRLGADGRVDAATDPAVKELTESIVALSKDFGILTEYTAFLAREGTDLANIDHLLFTTNTNLDRQAMQTRSGLSSVAQSVNNGSKGSQIVLNKGNSMFAENMERVQFANVAQVADRTLYMRNGVWTDVRALSDDKEEVADHEVQFGSEDYGRLAERLASQGRQSVLALGKDLLIRVEDEEGQEEVWRVKP